MDEYIDSEVSQSSRSPGDGLHPTGAYIKIVEQPAKCGVRFRYECEGRISGAIPGAMATTISPTYPTVKVMNYQGRAKVIVSCVTKNMPYRPHPHNLVGKKSCKDGICVQYIDNEEMTASFTNLGILCAKRKDIKERLRTRESLNVDPFGTGFGHKSQAFKMIDLAVVRLGFQVFLEGPQPGEYNIQLEPVVSDPIYDKKAMSELAIAKLSHYSAPCVGGNEVILLCDRVIKDDIQIRFFEERNDILYWESFAEFKSSDIHKHFAISFRTPKYVDENITSPVAVNVQLKRPSDGGCSESLPFYILPKVDNSISHKRQRISTFPYQSMKASFNGNTPSQPSAQPKPTVFVPRFGPQNQEYILPRLLSQHQASPAITGQEFLSATHNNMMSEDQNQSKHANSSHANHQHQHHIHGQNEFLDLDIGIMEDGMSDFNSIGSIVNGTHLAGCNLNDATYWNNLECKDDNNFEVNSAEYIIASSEDILDISSNTNAMKQWQSLNQKQFLTAL